MCLPLLQERWSPGSTVAQVLTGIAELVNDPAAYDPLANYSRRSWLSELLRTDPDEYAANARAETRRSAGATPAEIVAGW